jgi:hypothetical protein
VTAETLGRFGHHPDPAIDFEIEVDDLVGMEVNRTTGFDPEPDLDARTDRALKFIVGGVATCIEAKDHLREIYARLRQQESRTS